MTVDTSVLLTQSLLGVAPLELSQTILLTSSIGPNLTDKLIYQKDMVVPLSILSQNLMDILPGYNEVQTVVLTSMAGPNLTDKTMYQVDTIGALALFVQNLLDINYIGGSASTSIQTSSTGGQYWG